MSMESQHWYRPDGTTCHTQYTKPGAKNPTRPTNISDARKLGLLPSVSGITQQWASYDLVRYKMRKVAEAAFHSPPIGDEDKNEWIATMIDKSSEDASAAADIGTIVHDAIEKVLTGGSYNKDQEVVLSTMQTVYLKALVDPALEAYEALGVTPTGVEKVLVNKDDGYAGKTDIVFDFGIIDWKSMRTKEGEKIKPRQSHPPQLAAYLKAAKGGIFKDFWCANIYISTTEPGRVEMVEYDADQLRKAYQLFDCCNQLWRAANNYDPRNLA